MAVGSAGVLGLVVAAAALGGCAPRARPPAVVVAYEGPLLTTAELLAELSARAATVRTVWARHDFSVVALDARGRERRLDGDGVLQLRKSGDVTEIRLTGSRDVVGRVFDLGSNRERSWLTFFGDVDEMVWVDNRIAGRLDPRELPIRPDLVAQVLGLGDWPTDPTRFPAPVLTFDPMLDQYQLTLVEVADDGGSLTTRRQVWVDRATLEIRRITFFGPDGRPVASSQLSQWRPLEEARGGRGGGAGPATPSPAARGWVPTDVVLSFPLSRANLRLRLTEARASRNNLPGDISFRFPTDPGVATVRELGRPQW